MKIDLTESSGEVKLKDIDKEQGFTYKNGESIYVIINNESIIMSTNKYRVLDLRTMKVYNEYPHSMVIPGNFKIVRDEG